jgi:Ca2+-binding RTX toxin-like protein
MATTITVPGANGTTVSLSYDTLANAALAQRIADALRNGVDNKTILPVDNKFGPPPSLPTGVTGEFIQSVQGVTLLPQGYMDVVNTAKTGAIYGSGDPNEQVLSGGQGNLTFFATGGSGTVAAGGGNNYVSIPTTDAGGWLVATGNGNDTILALGRGNDTISAGGGSNVIQVGAGNTFIGSAGADTILASTGSETITAVDAKATDVVFGNASNVFFVGGAGATVFGGTGSDTVFGGTGPNLLFGGSAGNNFLQAGQGPATLYGGGNNDQLYTGGSGPQELHAAGGNATLFGAFSSGNDSFYGGSGTDQVFGNGVDNTFVAGAGAATVTAIASASNLFEFTDGQAGGTELVGGLTAAAQVHIALTGYGANEAANAVAGQTTNGSSVTITLSDNTKVTFENITHLTSGNFT